MSLSIENTILLLQRCNSLESLRLARSSDVRRWIMSDRFGITVANHPTLKAVHIVFFPSRFYDHSEDEGVIIQDTWERFYHSDSIIAGGKMISNNEAPYFMAQNDNILRWLNRGMKLHHLTVFDTTGFWLSPSASLHLKDLTRLTIVGSDLQDPAIPPILLAFMKEHASLRVELGSGTRNLMSYLSQLSDASIEMEAGTTIESSVWIPASLQSEVVPTCVELVLKVAEMDAVTQMQRISSHYNNSCFSCLERLSFILYRGYSFSNPLGVPVVSTLLPP